MTSGIKLIVSITPVTISVKFAVVIVSLIISYAIPVTLTLPCVLIFETFIQVPALSQICGVIIFPPLCIVITLSESSIPVVLVLFLITNFVRFNTPNGLRFSTLKVYAFVKENHNATAQSSDKKTFVLRFYIQKIKERL